MPDTDQGDIFLHHRGAILDALLSDLYFGESEIGESGEDVEIPVVSAPVLERPPAPEFDESSPREFDSVDRFEVAGAEPVEPPRRRSSVGPSASQRINALLSGQLDTPAPESDPDYAQATADRINRDATDQREAAEQAAAEAARPPAARRPSPRQMIQEAGAQLRQPKIALAAAAAVALLIVVLLVFTGGEKPEETKPLAVVPPPSAAPTSAEEAESGSGVIEVRSAEANCPPGSTDGMDAFSGEPDKAWSCVRAYKVDGQILRIDLGKEYKVDSIGIVPGWDHVGSDGTDQWSEFRTVSTVSYDLDDEDESTDSVNVTQKTLDQRSLVVSELEPPVTASEIVLTVLKSAGSRSTNTVAISSIVITGRE